MVTALLIILLVSSLALIGSGEPQSKIIYTGYNFMVQYGDQVNPLNLTSRASIYEFIESNPGTHMRNICSNLGISIGQVQYHLERLSDYELIESEKESKYKRFFVSRVFTEFEKRVLAYLRKPNAEKIIKYTSFGDGCSHQELAELLGVSSQAVTWHVQRLTEDMIIEAYSRENSTVYQVTDATRVALDNIQYVF